MRGHKQGTAGRKPRILNKRFKRINWKKLVAALLVTGLVWLSWTHIGSKTNQATLEKKINQQQAELDKKLQELEHSNLNAQQLQEQTLRLEAEKVELQKQVQAKKNKVYAESIKSPSAPQVVVPNCGDNEYAHFIYMHESGCRTTALNSIGCYGIGQSCPASKIAHCGADYACQNAWFSNYAITRYGSWAGAYAFWQSHRWW